MFKQTPLRRLWIGPVAILLFAIGVLLFETETLAASPSPRTDRQDATLMGKRIADGPTCNPSWDIVGSPSGTPNSLLNSISVLAPNDIWAVGFSDCCTAGDRTLALHWDGTAWNRIPTPNIGAGRNRLWGVTAISPFDIWAVGDYLDSMGGEWTLTMRWTGSWNIVPSRNMGKIYNGLYDVVALAPNDVWAVGTYVASLSDPYRTLIEHWDGFAWSVVPSPNVGGTDNWLAALAAVDPVDIWAVGGEGILGVYQTLALHWDGVAWSIIPSSVVPGGLSAFNGAVAVAGNYVMAVGYASVGGGPDKAFAALWNGTAWVLAPTPAPGVSSTLTGVAATGPNDMWAVGRFYSSPGAMGQPLTMHWDGANWSFVPSPTVGMGTDGLADVAAVSPNEYWAVGFTNNSATGVEKTLVEHMTCY